MGAGAAVFTTVSVSFTKKQIFERAPFKGPTPRIASPRQDLPIPQAKARIAEGLQQNDGKLTRDPASNPKKTPPLRFRGTRC